MREKGLLKHHKHYLQVALNSTLEEAKHIIFSLPPSDRILIEAGTPLIKAYGMEAVSRLSVWWQQRLAWSGVASPAYVVADMKVMDRGEREVEMASRAGAQAVVALGEAPTETLNVFLEACENAGVDAMIDMMNVEKPYQILRKLTRLPQVVILHRGVDEEEQADAPLPIHMITKIKGAFNTRISIAGGDTPREIQSAIFNGADIVVLWRDFYRYTGDAARVATEFLKQVK